MKNSMIVCLAAIVLAACSKPSTEAEPSGFVDVETALDQLTIENLKTHYNVLAADALQGRMTGEPGYDEAAQYVADQFAAFGLTPGGDDGWFQEVPLISYRVDTEQTSLVAHRDGEDRAFQYREDYAMSGDKVREESSVRAEVVYVGFGVHAPDLGYSDYENVDVNGKIVALFGGAPATFPHNERAFYSSFRTKYDEASKRGAVGGIVLRSNRARESFPWERYQKVMGTRPGMAWVSATGAAADYYPEIHGSVVINESTATEILAGTAISFEEAQQAINESRPSSVPLGFEVSLSNKTTHESITSPNVIGIVRGTDPQLADEYVVYSAHLDHLGVGVEEEGDGIYNGAYDNAMGVALMLETARAFAASPPRRSVLFIALTGEERGLLGSDYFAHYPTVDADKMIANVNLDMPLFLYPLADLVAFGAEHSSLEPLVSAAAEAEGFALTPDPVPEETLFIRSDQYSFVRRGVPAIFLVPGFTSSDPDIDGGALFQDFIRNHYHRPSDDLSRPVDWESALRFTRANMRIGTEVGNADGRPSWNEGDFFGERFGRD